MTAPTDGLGAVCPRPRRAIVNAIAIMWRSNALPSLVVMD
jgi:hypothetical protein